MGSFVRRVHSKRIKAPPPHTPWLWPLLGLVSIGISILTWSSLALLHEVVSPFARLRRTEEPPRVRTPTCALSSRRSAELCNERILKVMRRQRISKRPAARTRRAPWQTYLASAQATESTFRLWPAARGFDLARIRGCGKSPRGRWGSGYLYSFHHFTLPQDVLRFLDGPMRAREMIGP